MKLTTQQRKVLTALANGPVKHYEFHRLYVLNYTGRISELRAKGFDIPAPTIRKRISTYTLPVMEVLRARRVLRAD